MTNRLKTVLTKLLVLAGYLSFIILSEGLNVLLILALALLVLVVILEWLNRGSAWIVLVPFSSGLLGLAARSFYWDRFDFANRINNLLLISLVFSLGWAIHKWKLISRIFHFFKRLKFRKKLMVIFIFSEIILVMASLVIVERGVTLVGDEAHYLVISQSIARDMDINVFNQYARDKYQDFIPRHLRSHAKVGKGFKKWYSFHLPGLALTLSPFFILKLPIPLLYVLIRIYLGLFGSLLAVLVFLFAEKLWKREDLSLGITVVFCLTSPVIFLSIHVFAEVQALLMILGSLYVLLFGKQSRISIILAGLLLGLTVFWGMKYVIFIYILTLGFAVHFIRKKEFKKILWFGLFPVLFQLLFFAFLYLAYGNFSPMSIYTGVMSENQARDYYANVRQISFKNRIETLMDYFFDQRDGLLLYNPFYFFFFPGLIIALRKFRKYGAYLLLSSASFVYLLYHGYSTVRPGVCPQARYLVPVMWTLLVFAIIYYLETQNQFFKKVFWLVPLYSFFVVVFQVLNPYTLYQTTTHDYIYRSGLMFQKWSSLYVNVSTMLPSFIKSAPSLQPPFFKPSSNADYLPNLIGLSIFILLLIFALIRWKRSGVRWLAPVAFAGLFSIFVLFPRIPVYNPVLVNKSGTIPYLVHGAAFKPGRTVQKLFKIREDGVFRCLISTRRKAGFIRVLMENSGDRDVKVGIFNFNTRIHKSGMFNPGPGEIVVDNPRFRRFRNRFFYQFTFVVEGEDNGQPRLSIEFLAKKK